MKTNSLWDKRTGGEKGEWLRAVGVPSRTVLCPLWAWPGPQCGENVCVLPCRGMHVQRWAGGYPIFWVKAGMEGC